MNEILYYIGDMAIPDSHQEQLEKNMERAGVETSLYSLYAAFTIASFFLAIIGGVVAVTSRYLSGAPLLTDTIVFLVVAAISFVILLSVGRFVLEQVLTALIKRRSDAMEEEFPEFLTEVSLNLKSGHDLEDAMARAAQEDFGVLSEEVRRVTTKVDLGYNFEDALRDLMDGYDSDTITESLELVLISWRKGADTPQLIDRIVDNIKITRNLRSKIIASVANYRIFLATVTIAIAPAMMALAYYVLDLLRDITGRVQEVSQSALIDLSINAVRFDDTHFIWFSVFTLGVISLTTSFIVSHIRNGTPTAEWEKSILYLAGSLAAYAVFMVLFSGFFELFQL